jgi:fluoride exporter
MVLALAAAAALGAVARYLVDVSVQRRSSAALPLGTLAVNLSGSFVLGFLVGLGLYHGLGDPVRSVVGTGFVGAYTTFSTFSYETVRLLQDGTYRPALLNVALNLAGGLAAATVGLAIAGTVHA